MDNFVYFIIFLLSNFFSILATALIKRFKRAKELKSSSLQSLKEINEQYGIDESKILASINNNQQENIGNLNFKLL